MSNVQGERKQTPREIKGFWPALIGVAPDIQVPHTMMLDKISTPESPTITSPCVEFDRLRMAAPENYMCVCFGGFAPERATPEG